MNKKHVLALIVGISLAVSAQAQSPDSLTTDIASLNSQIEALEKRKTIINNDIDNYVSSYKTTELNRRRQDIDSAKRDGFLSESAYNRQIKKLQDTIEAEAKEKYSEKSNEYQSELDGIDSQKKELEDDRNGKERVLLNQTFKLRSSLVSLGTFDTSAKTFPVTVTIKEFASDTITVHYKLQLPGAGDDWEYVQKAREAKQKSYVADVFYRIKKSDIKDSYTVFITGVDVLTSSNETVTSDRTLNKESKTFKAGRLGVSEKSASSTTAVATKSNSSADVSLANASDDDVYRQIVFLLDQGLFKNKDQILTLSPALTFSQKNTLYATYEKSGAVPFLLNFLPCAVGSWVQKDFVSAGIITGIDALALIFILADFSDEESDGTLSETGLIMYLGATAFALIRPWFYANKYNNTLSFSLNRGTVSLTVLPIIEPTQNRYGIAAHITL